MKQAQRSKLRYQIIRIYRCDNDHRVLRTQVTHKHALEHCRNPESHHLTCKKSANLQRTAQRGPWYDIYTVLKKHPKNNLQKSKYS